MRVEPRLGAVGFGAHPLRQRPELYRMVHMFEVCDLVCGQIIKNEGGGEYQAP